MNHRLDGVLWPQRSLTGTPQQPVVVVPHQRLNLGPARLPRQLQLVLDGVIWVSLEELGQQDQLDPLLNLLTLPVRHEPELQLSSQQIH